MITNKYVVTFSKSDSIQLNIIQDINRPNNPDDYDLIMEYIFENYGYMDFYEIVELEGIKTIDI